MLALILSMFMRPVVIFSFGGSHRRAFDDLVELTAIQPDATTLGAVVDFNPLPFGHFQIDVAYGTLQWFSSLYGLGYGYPLRFSQGFHLVRRASLATRFSIGGYVLNRLIKPRLRSGLTINICAVAGFDCSGMRCDAASSFLRALARERGLPTIRAPPSSARYSLDRLIAI